MDPDRFSRFFPRQHNDAGARLALCVVGNHRGEKPMVTVYFPQPVYRRLVSGLPNLRSDWRGRWMVDSTQTSIAELKAWLERYDAWEAVRDAETVVFGEPRPRHTNDWYSQLLQKAS